MKKTNYQVKSSASQMLDVNYYEVEEPKALVQILHGMQEHKERYDQFASFLAEKGYSVVIHDHLGHGRSISDRHPLGDMVAFNYVLNDIDIVRKSVNFKGPFVLFGHSMGSFLARIYASQFRVDKLIACGTGQNSDLPSKAAKLLLKIKKPGVPLPEIQDMIMKRMEKHFEHPFDWLSYNKENQRAYIADPLCGEPFTREGFTTLLDIAIELNKTATYKHCSASGILLVSGEDDPVGDFGKGVKFAEEKYRHYGKNVRTILYPNMSHEILNEIEKYRVYEDVLAFLEEA